MDEYTENQQQKKKMFRNIRKSNNQEGKIKMNYTQAVSMDYHDVLSKLRSKSRGRRNILRPVRRIAAKFTDAADSRL